MQGSGIPHTVDKLTISLTRKDTVLMMTIDECALSDRPETWSSMKCPCRVAKHCAVQALPDICSCRCSSHSCTKTVHWSHEMLCSIFGPGYARPHILLQLSGIVFAPRSSCTTEKKNNLLSCIVFPLIFFVSSCFSSDVLSVVHTSNVLIKLLLFS